MSENLGALQTEVQAGFSSVLGEISTLKSEVLGEIASLKSDMSELRGDVSTLKADVSTLKAEAVETRRLVELLIDKFAGDAERAEFGKPKIALAG